MQRRAWDAPDVDDSLRRGEPLIITDIPLVRALAGPWTFDHLAQPLAGAPNVPFCPRTSTRLAPFPGGGAGSTGSPTGRRWSVSERGWAGG